MWSSLAGGVYHRAVFIRGNTLEVLLMYIKGKKVKFQNQPIAPCTFPFSFISPWVTHSNKSKLPSLNTNLKQKPTTPIHIMHVIKSGHTGRGKQISWHMPRSCKGSANCKFSSSIPYLRFIKNYVEAFIYTPLNGVPSVVKL